MPLKRSPDHSVPKPRTDTCIRPYHPDDRQALVHMLADSDPWKRLGYKPGDWDRMFEARLQDRETFVLELDGVVSGLALVRQRFLLGDYLELLVVAPHAQRKGCGARLLQHLEGVVFQRVKNLFVCVSDFNEGARKFYARHGYQEIGPIPNFLIPGSAELLLRKTTGSIRGK